MSKHAPISGFCVKCGTWRKHLHRDHIVPKWSGGADVAENWQYLCANCHEDKTYEERQSPAYRAFVSKQVKARMLSPEARVRISEAVKASNARRQWTPEQRAKCGRPGVKRAPFTAEHRARISAARKGMKFSVAHRDALSKAHKGKPWSLARQFAAGPILVESSK